MLPSNALAAGRAATRRTAKAFTGILANARCVNDKLTDTAGASPWWYQNRGPLFGAAYFIGFAMYWGGKPAPQPSAVQFGRQWGAVGIDLVLWLAALLVIAAWAIRVWGGAYLRANVVWKADVVDDTLIVDGPFRYLRNPLYLGNILMAIGFGLLAPPFGTELIVLCNVIIVNMLAGHEEKRLRATYGETFTAFRTAVPSLLPRLTPATVPGTITVAPDFRQAAIGEIAVGGMAIGMVALAIFGQVGLYVLYATIVVAPIVQSVVMRSRSTAR